MALILIPLVLSLGLDTFAVSTAIGVAGLPPRARRRVVVAFALAEGLMPALGVALGSGLGTLLRAVDTAYVAAALLVLTGLYLLREAREEDEVEGLSGAASRAGLPLLLLALSVSIDELAVGVSFGVLRPPLAPVLAAIALQAAVVSALGLQLGAALGRAAGRYAGLSAALVLILLGCAIAIGRLTGHEL